MTKKTKCKLRLKGAIDSLKKSLAEIDQEIKEAGAKLDLHGKLLGEVTLHYLSLAKQKKHCLETIDHLVQCARANGEEV